MSRLTSAQVISLGDYLEPDFEPSSLTVSQLLGVLGYHNVVYPSPYSKPKLIALFNTEIKPNASKFRKQRIKADASIASDDGITDGHTGEPLRKVRVSDLAATRDPHVCAQSRLWSAAHPDASPARLLRNRKRCLPFALIQCVLSLSRVVGTDAHFVVAQAPPIVCPA